MNSPALLDPSISIAAFWVEGIAQKTGPWIGCGSGGGGPEDHRDARLSLLAVL